MAIRMRLGLALISVILAVFGCSEAYGSSTALLGIRKAAPGGSVGGESKRYAVIFDAGSTGSRVHVFSFDQNLDLVAIGSDMELLVKIEPGLSAYADCPHEAAKSLIPLLEAAKKVIPEDLRPTTPVKLGATAGLRLVGEDKAKQILKEVRNLFQSSSLKYKAEWVIVLAGSQEGSYLWIALNYVLGNLGRNYANTVAVLDLGGGSVQMSYAISQEAYEHAPWDSADPYVQGKYLKDTVYYLYSHSYLHYGLMAGRAEILKAGNGKFSYCILGGYEGSYEYGGEEFNASASPSGASYTSCRKNAQRALKIDATCAYMDCTFGGVWSGGGGDGQTNIYVASFFFNTATHAGFVHPNATVAEVRPADFMQAAKSACRLTLEDAKAKYPLIEEKDLPYICMDLVYEYTLLVDGFGLAPEQKVTVVDKVKYGNSYLDAAWPLGSAIEVISGGVDITFKSKLATTVKNLLCSWFSRQQFCGSLSSLASKFGDALAV